MSATLREVRDQLLAWRGDHAAAVAGFEWPDVGDQFNWGVDWFDAFARGNPTPGLVIVEEADQQAGSPGSSWTFDELATRSDQVAARLAEWGVTKGEAVLVMLGNQVELWEPCWR